VFDGENRIWFEAGNRPLAAAGVATASAIDAAAAASKALRIATSLPYA